jgi:hypothetical protein
MTRRLVAIVLAGLLGLGGAAGLADEPSGDPGDAPLRLKKKKADDKKPEPAKAAEKKGDDTKADDKKPEKQKAEPGDSPAEPEQDEKEVMERLARNMRSVDERLGKGDLTEGTRQLQDDILKDLESLIRSSENPSGGGGGGQQNQNQDQQNQDNQNNDKQSGAKQNQQSKGSQGGAQAKGGSSQEGGQEQRGERQGSARGKRKSDGRQRGQLTRGNRQGQHQQAGPAGPRPRPGNPQPNSATANGKNPGESTGDTKSNAELNPNADLNKQDVWGHLPESMRAAMNAYAGRQEFMAKHEALIKKYYSTIAAEGRRKGEQ